VFALLREELPPARAAKLAAAITGAPRKGLYTSEV
jgi:16S rRNA (cytidine1402-2'-O)-methyltransferase